MTTEPNFNWKTATPVQLLFELNSKLMESWKESEYQVLPDCIWMSPERLRYLLETFIDSTNITLLSFLRDNSITVASGRNLEVECDKSVADETILIGHNRGVQ